MKVFAQYIKLKKREIAEHNKVSDGNKKDWERKKYYRRVRKKC